MNLIVSGAESCCEGRRPSFKISTIGTTIPRARCHPAAHRRTDSGAGASRNSMVCAEHPDARTELGSAKRNHVLSDVSGDNLTVLGSCVGENILDEVVAVLVACNVNERDARAVNSTLANTVKVATEKLRATNLQALLYDLGSELVHAILGGIADDVINSAAPVRRSAVFTDMLDTPVSELAMGHDVDVGQNFLNTGTLNK